jgi:uncharacterized integral membrane protein
MRLITILLVLAFAAGGAIFGALNSDSVGYDFYFAQFNAPKGAILIAAVLLGWLIGGALVYFTLVLGLRRRLRAQQRDVSPAGADAAAPIAQPPADAERSPER